MAFVLDASVTAAWMLPDESNPLADHVEDLLLDHHAFVPAVWRLEVCNILIVAERRKRLSGSQINLIQNSLAELPIVVDNKGDGRELIEIARRNKLTAYDASYIELAKRSMLPLATLDKAMARAAINEQVDLVLAISG
jgi:predicted nucleic acid-binding protein